MIADFGNDSLRRPPLRGSSYTVVMSFVRPARGGVENSIVNSEHLAPSDSMIDPAWLALRRSPMARKLLWRRAHAAWPRYRKEAGTDSIQ